jgi:tetratricopeptide (TPR) repeat protein
MTLAAGAAEALRTWIVSKSARLADVSVQVAFELFRLNRRLEPLVYGLLVRPIGGDAEAAAASLKRCHSLSDRVVAVHENGVWRHAKNRFLKDRFLFIQFRLAVMSRLRAINLDSQKKVKESIAEIAYSDRLNASNPSLVKILRRMDWIRRQNGETLTPREGLEIAMKRADFVMARRYAMPVLKEDPDDPNANFAMGMSYYAEEQFAKAEEYLKRVLKKNPDEPAVYNNLALICLQTGRPEEAETNVVYALKLKPDVAEIKDTAQQVEKAKNKRKRTP